jgi:large subunit ribosomal protein L22
MEVIAKANNIRMSPRKVRLVIDVIRGMDVMRAQTQLRFMKKAAALPVLKLLNSAIANAEHNFDMDKDGLIVKMITADGGPVIHRWTPKAFGRSAPIRKRTSHITILLSSKSKTNEKMSTRKSDKEAKPKTIRKAAKKPAVTKTK